MIMCFLLSLRCITSHSVGNWFAVLCILYLAEKKNKKKTSLLNLSVKILNDYKRTSMAFWNHEIMFETGVVRANEC